MFGKLVRRARNVTENLSRFDAQPIGRAALTVVIFLDIFILMSIFDGLADHVGQITSPYDFVPSHCQEIVLDNTWNATERLPRIAGVVNERNASPVPPDEKPAYDKMHPTCAKFERLVNGVVDDKTLSGSLTRYLQVRRESASTRSELERIKGAYDTSLLEKMAAEGAQNEGAARLGTEVRELSEKISKLAAEQSGLESALTANPVLVALFQAIDAVSDEQRDQLRQELQQRNFWFPLKRLGMEMLFLLPLVLVFYFWNARSLSRGQPFQVLVSSHLLVVTLIPVVFRIARLVYDIIPRKLLKKVIELLESLQLVALWYYLLIGAAALVALALIYLFQKKLFSHDRLLGRRIARGLCQGCGMHLSPMATVCPLCGFHQFRKCSHCGKDTYVHGKYCRECGHTETGTE
jgi:hypothetical protein